MDSGYTSVELSGEDQAEDTSERFFFSSFFFCLHYAACGIFVPWLGIEPVLPALEVWVLTTGLPGKSNFRGFNMVV